MKKIVLGVVVLFSSKFIFAEDSKNENLKCSIQLLGTKDDSFEHFNMKILGDKIFIQSDDWLKHFRKEVSLVQIHKIEVNKKTISWYSSADITDYYVEKGSSRSSHSLFTFLITKETGKSTKIGFHGFWVRDEKEISTQDSQGLCK